MSFRDIGYMVQLEGKQQDHNNHNIQNGNNTGNNISGHNAGSFFPGASAVITGNTINGLQQPQSLVAKFGPCGCSSAGGNSDIKVKHAKIGKWGSQEPGNVRDVRATPERLLKVRVTADGNGISSISFCYKATDGKTYLEGPWGANHGTAYEIDLERGYGESLTEISGTTGFWNQYVVVRSLKFVSTKGKTYGPYGRKDGTPFTAQVFNGGCIKGFFGRSGQYLDAIGIYVNPN